MFLRKLGATVTAAALSLTLLAGSALAETPAPEWEAPLKAKLETISQLKTQTEALTTQLKQQSETNKALQQQLRTAVAGAAPAELAELKAKLEAAAAPIKAQLAPLEEQLQAAKAAGDKVQAVVIRARIAELKLKLAVEIAALQPLRDQVKALQAVAKASRESLKTALAPLQPLVDQEKALAAANQELRNQAKTAREAAQAAMKAGNWSTMLSEFDTVIRLQQQALTNLQQIGGLKTQIGAGLQAAIDAHK